MHRLPPRLVFRQSEAARAGVGSRTLYRLVDDVPPALDPASSWIESVRDEDEHR